MEEKLNLCILMLNNLRNHKESLDKEFAKLIDILKRFRLEYFYFRKDFLSRWWSLMYKRPLLYIYNVCNLPWHSVFFFFKLYTLISGDNFSGGPFCLTILNCEIVWDWPIYSKLQVVSLKSMETQTMSYFS